MKIGIVLILIIVMLCSCTGQFQIGKIVHENAVDFNVFKVQTDLDVTQAFVLTPDDYLIPVSKIAYNNGAVYIYLDGNFIYYHMSYLLIGN